MRKAGNSPNHGWSLVEMPPNCPDSRATILLDPRRATIIKRDDVPLREYPVFDRESVMDC